VKPGTKVFRHQAFGAGGASGRTAHVSSSSSTTEEQIVTRRSRRIAGRLGIERGAKRVSLAEWQPQETERHVRIQSGRNLVRVLAKAGEKHGE
jgi:predicted transcriptional regulator